MKVLVSQRLISRTVVEFVGILYILPFGAKTPQPYSEATPNVVVACATGSISRIEVAL